MEQYLKHLRWNGERYRRDFGWSSNERRLSMVIQAIKQLRQDTNCGLLDGKNAVEAWQAEGCPITGLTVAEAKILLRNLLLRGEGYELTSLEMDAIRRMAE